MQRIWKTPTGEYSRIYRDMLSQTHLLIAGATGSGKSTVVNGIIHAGLFFAPCDIQFILIDPKGTELIDYKRLPHTIQYATAIPDCISALRNTLDIVKARFAEMQRRHEKLYNGSDIYVIIDELMFLLNRPNYKRIAMDLLQDILVIARAAKIHVIACTQSPTAATGLPVNLRCNFDSRLGLRTTTQQDSRNIIGVKGCETFPRPVDAGKAYGYYMRNGDMNKYVLPRIPQTDIDGIVQHWIKNGRGKIRLFG